MGTRTIIQIVAQSFAVDAQGDGYSPALFALASDGSVWLMHEPNAGAAWKALPSLPAPPSSPSDDPAHADS